jgi:hypothetical protein
MAINGDASTIIAAVDVDAMRSHVYWIDGQKMRRAAVPKDPSQLLDPQDMCAVTNPQGIAVDWVMRYGLRCSVRLPVLAKILNSYTRGFTLSIDRTCQGVLFITIA